MKPSHLVWAILPVLLCAVIFHSSAQQTEADGKLLADIRTKAEKGDAQAQAALGNTFSYGKLGMPKDETEAVKWYRKAADQDYASAQFNLAQCYAEGQGVAKDEMEAAKWYRKAAEQSLTKAQVNLGYCYDRGLGVAQDETEATKWYRKAAEHNDAQAQFNLGLCYADGRGVSKDESEAVQWLRKAAEQNFASAQGKLGFCYANGQGVTKDEAEAVKWYNRAAEQNLAQAQAALGVCYATGKGVAKDESEAVKWYRKAAEQNNAPAQFVLALCYDNNQGVAKDYVEAYKWCLLAAGQGKDLAKQYITILENEMTREQIAEGQRLARNFKPRNVPAAGSDSSSASIAQTRPESSGSGFFITEDGYLISNYHVVKDAAQVRLVTSAGLIAARVVRVDAANDLALLKAEGSFTPLPVAASRTAHLGSPVATIGFPNPGLQGFAPKFAKGEIAALSGAGDDARYFQISVPVQPGNSGGALVDEHGNVVGVVSAKLDAAAALAASGALPENVNYAIKSSFVLSFLESSPEVSAKLKEPVTAVRKFDDVVQSAQQAAVLVLVY